MKKNTKNKTLTKRRRDRRAMFMGAFFCLCLVVLMYRIWYWQNAYGEEFSRRVVATTIRRDQVRAGRETMPSRGTIVDRNMQPIASSQPVYNVFLDVNLLHEGRRTSAGRNAWEATLYAINEKLGVPRRDLAELFDTHDGTYNGDLLHPTHHRYVAHEIQGAIALPLRDTFRHIHVTEVSQRWHHDPFFAPQVIGFIRGDATWGLEYQYDTQLTGEIGRSFWLQGDVEEVPVQDGFTLVTTLDADIQRLAQSLVDETHRTFPFQHEFVGMIVKDPFTGEILAMAQAPTFSLADPLNPDYITDIRLRNNWDSLSDDEQLGSIQRLWQNFHTNRAYEPGSIFKPAVIAAAIEEGVITPNCTFFCGGSRAVADRTVYCWTRHGSLSLRSALYRSCNLAMVEIMNRLGRDRFYRYRGYFGFGERTGIDFPFETAVSSPAVMYPFARLGPVELATSSIGQGFNASPLQSINSMATLINGGNVMRPMLVSHLVDASGQIVQENRPEVVRRAISTQTSDFIRTEMRYVVEAQGGTAFRTSRIPGHAIGGKTGTGQQGTRDNRINTLTYIAYTPVENPEFLVLMFVDRVYDPLERASAGGHVAPVVRRFFEELIRLRNLSPSDGAYNVSDWEIAMGAEVMPNFSGQRLSDVIRNLNNTANVGYQVAGRGTIISHTVPAPGMLMPQNNATIFFHMDDTTYQEGQMSIVPDVVGLTDEQASTFINSAGLTTVLVVDRDEVPEHEDSTGARTFAAPTAENDIAPPAPVQQGPQPYIVYQQFPAPNSIVERGTQILVRAR